MAHDSDSSGRRAKVKVGGKLKGKPKLLVSTLPSLHFLQQTSGVCVGKRVKKEREIGRVKTGGNL